MRSGYKKAGSCRSGSSGGLLPVLLLDAVLNTSRSRNHRQVVSVTVSPPTVSQERRNLFPKREEISLPKFRPGVTWSSGDSQHMKISHSKLPEFPIFAVLLGKQMSPGKKRSRLTIRLGVHVWGGSWRDENLPYPRRPPGFPAELWRPHRRQMCLHEAVPNKRSLPDPISPEFPPLPKQVRPTCSASLNPWHSPEQEQGDAPICPQRLGSAHLGRKAGP